MGKKLGFEKWINTSQVQILPEQVWTTCNVTTCQCKNMPCNYMPCNYMSCNYMPMFQSGLSPRPWLHRHLTEDASGVGQGDGVSCLYNKPANYHLVYYRWAQDVKQTLICFFLPKCRFFFNTSHCKTWPTNDGGWHQATADVKYNPTTAIHHVNINTGLKCGHVNINLVVH